MVAVEADNKRVKKEVEKKEAEEKRQKQFQKDMAETFAGDDT